MQTKNKIIFAIITCELAVIAAILAWSLGIENGPEAVAIIYLFSMLFYKLGEVIGRTDWEDKWKQYDWYAQDAEERIYSS